MGEFIHLSRGSHQFYGRASRDSFSEHANPADHADDAGLSRAFSMIELMAVLGVVALLAAILLPTLARAKAGGKSTVCLNNLKQWGIATHLYVTDHDDFLPPDGSPNGSSKKSGWYIDLPNTIGIPNYAQLDWPTNPAVVPPKSIWVCPNSTNRSNGNNLFFYCLNQHVNDTGLANRPVMIDSIRSPALTVWLFDNGRRAAVAQQNNVALDVHGGGAHFLFLDGHAGRFQKADFWDSAGNRGRTNNPDLVWNPR